MRKLIVILTLVGLVGTAWGEVATTCNDEGGFTFLKKKTYTYKEVLEIVQKAVNCSGGHMGNLCQKYMDNNLKQVEELNKAIMDYIKTVEENCKCGK